jgi:GNAT superfamily N-acetyltransferase
MNRVEIIPVNTPSQYRQFVSFAWRIYKNDPLWVPPLLPERLKTLNPARGPFFKRGGTAECFIAYRDGRPVGTICAAEDPPTNQVRNTRECMIGFFECIDDEVVAKALFNQAAGWARQRNLDALYGPFNLDYEDSYGVLIEGRDRPPVLLCGHTPPYYQRLFECYGFVPARGDNLAYEITPRLDTPQVLRLHKLADHLRQRGRIHIRSGDLEHWDQEIERIYGLLNRALAHLPDFIPWHREAVQASMEPFRQIVDPELILFAEYDGETVGWFPGIPNLNEAFIHANGLRYPWDYASLWWQLRKTPKCLAVKSVLVLPEYWDTGVAILLFDEMATRAAAKGYKWLDLSLTSEDNPYTPTLATRMGAQLYKRYRVYRLGV